MQDITHLPARRWVSHIQSNNVDGVTIAGNTISHNGDAHGMWIVAGSNSPDNEGSNGNIVQNVRIVNNLIDNGLWGISLAGGFGRSNDNQLKAVTITNNTLTNNTATGILSIENNQGTTGNLISGVMISNTILWGNEVDLSGLESTQVFSSVTDSPGFSGINGNISSDPAFVDPAIKDFRLQSISPAINAGTSEGAPREDLDCRKRDSAPDIGAFEFGDPVENCSLSDRIFDWAEYKYPGLFGPPAESASFRKYYYRYYPEKDNYLAVDGDGTLNYLGPLSNNKLLNLGPARLWSSRARADGF